MPYPQTQPWQLWIEKSHALVLTKVKLLIPRLKSFRRFKHKAFLLLLVATISLNILIAACTKAPVTPGTAPSPQQTAIATPLKPIELSLVAFSVAQGAYAEIIPLFKQKWQLEHHQEVIFQESYAGSSTQTRAIVNGLPTDIAHLSLALDVNRLQQAGLVLPGWEQRVPNHDGIVTRTVGAIITRAGNPKQIHSWSDLAKPGISVITADPKTSGIARWNFLAFWGAITQTGGTEAEALNFATQVYQNVPVLAKDARESTDIFFRQEKGDILINYENEFILSHQQGLAKNTAAIIPEVNISIDNPITLVDKYVNRRGTREVAEAFLQFLYTPAAQRAFAKVGFRPLNSLVIQEFSQQFPPLKKLFTAAAFGGWDAIQNKFFKDGGIFDQIQMDIKSKKN